MLDGCAAAERRYWGVARVLQPLPYFIHVCYMFASGYPGSKVGKLFERLFEISLGTHVAVYSPINKQIL